MKVTFYDTRITEDYKTVLVEEKSITYAKESISNPQDTAIMMRKISDIDKLGEEHCYMLAMNTKCRVLGVFLLSKGTIDASFMGTREIFVRALLAGASNIVLCHNHPSKDCAPSQADIDGTKKVRDAGELMRIPLLDHIVIGGASYFSFREHDML